MGAFDAAGCSEHNLCAFAGLCDVGFDGVLFAGEPVARRLAGGGDDIVMITQPFDRPADGTVEVFGDGSKDLALQGFAQNAGLFCRQNGKHLAI